MTDNPDRRRIMQLSLAAVPVLMALGRSGSALAEERAKPAASGAGPQHDFDFFLGSWNVRHRRLSSDWQTIMIGRSSTAARTASRCSAASST